MQALSKRKAVHYPDSDGKPMADNTLQYEWIVTIKGGLDLELQDFVGGDLLWYPVEGNPKIRVAPDVLVAFGRPKGNRGSYRPWEEGGIQPQVVWEILSPGNTHAEMREKLRFYQTYGVEEYYIYDPDRNQLEGWMRKENLLQPVENMNGWTSPRLKIRFELQESGLLLFHRNGERFLTFQELGEKAKEERERAEAERRRAELGERRAEVERKKAATERKRAENERKRAESERKRAEAGEQRAEAERKRAEAGEQRAEVERKRAEDAEERVREAEAKAAALAAKLKELGISL